MRIRVTTSINIRSNTVPPSPAPVNDAVPKLPEIIKVIEKPRSKSPISFLNPRPEMATARFKASQRPPRGSHLSAWLHGFSVVRDDRGHAAAHNKQTTHTSTHCYSRTPRRGSHDRPTGLRPAASTRGVIDPVHSPSSNVWPMPSHHRQAGDIHRSYSPYNVYHLPPKTRSRTEKPARVQKLPNKTCFSQITDPKVRRKAIGCLSSGTILTIVLTIYLALAASNTAHGATFHAIFIFFILLLTIIFIHYLLRLCMLAFKPQARYKPRRSRHQTSWPSDEEIGFVQPTEPIPILLAQDEGLHVHENQVADPLVEEDEGSEKDLPPPPPIYGNWRGSVRADPDLIHWQLHTNQPDVQQEARELIFAGSGHRPPSYTSDEMVEGGIGRPLPLFAERRAANVVVV